VTILKKRGKAMSTVLGKDEQIIKENTFTANLLLFWLKANYCLTNKRITGDTPNTVLGLIPIGKAQIAQPLKTIASVSSSTKFYIGRLIIGLFLFMIGVAWLSFSFLVGLVITGFGLLSILNCYTATFVILNNGGQSVGYGISILEKSKVETFVNDINTVIADL
jgi:hypothetical protein